MNSRDRILGKLRGNAATTPTAVADRIRVPAFDISGERDSLIKRFRGRAELSGARVKHLGSAAELPAVLEELGLSTSDTAEIDPLASDDNDIYLARADAGIAETGTVCIHSKQHRSASLFLCEHLVVLLNSSDVLPCQEDYWSRSTAHYRALHLITGPSRTADVEQTLQIGAHGPRVETILLLDDTSSS